MTRLRLPLPHAWRAAAASTALALALGGCSGGGAPERNGSGGSAPPPGATGGSRPTGSATSGEPATATTGAGSPASGSPSSTRPIPTRASVTATLATGLEVPWGVAALSDGSLLVTERMRGDVVRVRAGRPAQRVGQVPGVVAEGEGGLLGLALAPDFASNPVIYLYLTTRSDNRVVRMRFTASAPAGRQLSAPEPILTGIPKGQIHNGGALLFGHDGLLYVSTGETGQRSLAQDRSSLGGKILRVRADGSVPPGNPFPGSPVYSYGHRNVEGLAFDSRGRLWASEFGEHTWDELNLILPGRNYGWPTVEGVGHRSGLVNPVSVFATDQVSPGGLAIVDDVAYLGALRGQRLWQVPLAAPDQTRSFLSGALGRLRAVVATGDGGLWVTTSNRDGRGSPRPGDDRVVRVDLR